MTLRLIPHRGQRSARLLDWRLPLAACVAIALAGCGGPRTDSGGSGGAGPELRTSSDQTDGQNRATIRLQLAVGYYEQRQLQVALDEVKQALAADPDLADAYGVRGLIYMDLGEIRLAEENFLRAIRLAPNNPDLTNNYGWFLCQNGRAAESIAHFEATLKNPSYQSPAKALHNAGVCSLRMDKKAEAERYFLQAFRFDPANRSVSANLARMFYQSRDYERAQFYLSLLTKDAKKNEALEADVLWLALKVGRKLGDRAGESSLAENLRRHHGGSAEYSAYKRGAFDE